MKKVLLSLLLAVFFVPVYSQISHGGEPYSNQASSLKASIDYKILPEVDVEKLLFEDAIDESNPDIPWRFGKDMPVNYNLENSGTWEVLENGDRIWRLEITSYGAYSINLIYDAFYMPQGASFFVYNPQKSHVIGSFTYENNKEGEVFATVPVKGETSILEYYEPAASKGLGKLSVSYVIHAYKDLYDKSTNGFGSSGSCNVNVNCPEGNDWRDAQRGVAMILTANNARKCSGSLINNTADDGTPYFLTANHCGIASADTWIIMFNYESPGCEDVDGPTNQSIQYTTLLANSYISDMMLLELSEVPPIDYNVYYNGWSRSTDSMASSTCIHHPKGDIKKISHDYDYYTSDKYLGTQGVEGSYWKITQWDLGTTEGGSSGSPLFNPQKQIIGQLHGGWASCTNLEPDWYGKFSYSWDYFEDPARQLKQWLDPLNLDVESWTGFDPTIAQFENNAAIVSAIAPLSQYNGETTVRPEYVIRNMGSQKLMTLNVSMQLDEGEIMEYAWTGNLDTYDTAHVLFPEVELIHGEYDFRAYCDSPNGLTDQYPLNDTLDTQVLVNMAYDISITDFKSPDGVDCNNDTTKIEFELQNTGALDVEGVIVHVVIDEGETKSYEFEEPLMSGEKEDFSLHVLQQDAQWHDLFVEVEIINQEDEYPADNTHNTTYNTYGNSIGFVLKTDSAGSETSWILRTEDGVLLGAGIEHEPLSEYKDRFCLAKGCYEFVIYDEGGNGIQIPPGSFELSNHTYEESLLRDSIFSDSLFFPFCISNTLLCDFILATDSTCTDRDIQFINQSANADYFQWFFEGGNPIAPVEVNPIIRYATAGVYDVKLTAWQGTESIVTIKEDFVTVVECAGIEELVNNLFTIYPNPSSGQITIELTNEKKFDELRIFNTMGAIVLEQKLGQSSSTNLNLELEAGAYIVELKSQNKLERKMLIINK